MKLTPEQKAERLARTMRAISAAKKILQKGDRIRVTRCPGTKRWVMFDHWDGNWIVSKSGIDDISAGTIDMLNGDPVDFRSDS